MANGKVVKLQSVEDYLNGQVSALAFTPKTLFSWWKPATWWAKIKSWFVAHVNLKAIIVAMVKATDDLIQIVEKEIIPGIDKKAAVLDAVGRLFDRLVAPALPPIIRPLSGVIRSIIVDMILPHVIDFIVAKYNNGIWKAS